MGPGYLWVQWTLETHWVLLVLLVREVLADQEVP